LMTMAVSLMMISAVFAADRSPANDGGEYILVCTRCESHDITVEKQAQAYTYNYNRLSSHRLVCGLCGYIIGSQNHVFADYLIINQYMCRGTCVCGAVQDFTHSFITDTDSPEWEECSDCGFRRLIQ
jgi:hypothetical protein